MGWRVLRSQVYLNQIISLKLYQLGKVQLVYDENKIGWGANYILFKTKGPLYPMDTTTGITNKVVEPKNIILFIFL